MVIWAQSHVVLPQVGEGCSGVQDTMYNHELAREREGEGKRKYM